MLRIAHGAPAQLGPAALKQCSPTSPRPPCAARRRRGQLKRQDEMTTYGNAAALKVPLYRAEQRRPDGGSRRALPGGTELLFRLEPLCRSAAPLREWRREPRRSRGAKPGVAFWLRRNFVFFRRFLLAKQKKPARRQGGTGLSDFTAAAASNAVAPDAEGRRLLAHVGDAELLPPRLRQFELDHLACLR